MNKFNFLILILIFFLSGCAKNNVEEVSAVKKTSQELEMISSYNEAYQALNRGDPFLLQKNFLKLNFYTLNLIGLLNRH